MGPAPVDTQLPNAASTEQAAPQWNQARYSSSDAILEGGEAVLRRYIEIHTPDPTTGSASACVEGVDLSELPSDGLKQTWQFLLDRIWKP
jgi:hypothetical protein